MHAPVGLQNILITVLEVDYVFERLCRFYCKNNGVLYEDETVQIGIKTECRTNLARMALFYGNKTGYPFIVSTPSWNIKATYSLM